MNSDPNEHIGIDHQLPRPTAEDERYEERANRVERPRHKLIRAGVWILLLAIFALAFYFVLRHHDQTKAAAPSRHSAGGTATINTVTAARGDIGVYLDAIGTATPVYTSSITSQVNGIVTAVHYREGQIVHKGDPLIEIDSRPYRATLPSHTPP